MAGSRDYLVWVCSECLRASCWHGEFTCEDEKLATITRRLASELRALGREHPSHFSPEKIRKVSGSYPAAVTA